MKLRFTILILCLLTSLATPQTMHTPTMIIGTPPTPPQPGEGGPEIYGSAERPIYGSGGPIIP